MPSRQYIPSHPGRFFDLNLDSSRLYQGDVLSSKEIGLKDDNDDSSTPDFFMIITKTCDLSFDNQEINKTRSGSIVITPFRSLRSLVNRRMKIKKFINLIPLFSIFFKSSRKNIENIIKDKVSRFMFIPPDGKILTEPMVVDFGVSNYIDGHDPNEVSSVLGAKKIQLQSPFREKVAQRFALHYMSIGVDDLEIRKSEYVDNIKKNF